MFSVYLLGKFCYTPGFSFLIVTKPNLVLLACHSKANLLTRSFGEGKCSDYCKAPDKESGATNAQKT